MKALYVRFGDNDFELDIQYALKSVNFTTEIEKHMDKLPPIIARLSVDVHCLRILNHENETRWEHETFESYKERITQYLLKSIKCEYGSFAKMWELAQSYGNYGEQIVVAIPETFAEEENLELIYLI